MPRYIVKVTQSEDQTRVNIPKALAAATGLDKVRVAEVWFTKGRIIHIKEYHGKKAKESRD